jgi:hypothetical protein
MNKTVSRKKTSSEGSRAIKSSNNKPPSPSEGTPVTSKLVLIFPPLSPCLQRLTPSESVNMNRLPFGLIDDREKGERGWHGLLKPSVSIVVIVKFQGTGRKTMPSLVAYDFSSPGALEGMVSVGTIGVDSVVPALGPVDGTADEEKRVSRRTLYSWVGYQQKRG